MALPFSLLAASRIPSSETTSRVSDSALDKAIQTILREGNGASDRSGSGGIGTSTSDKASPTPGRTSPTPGITSPSSGQGTVDSRIADFAAAQVGQVLGPMAMGLVNNVPAAVGLTSFGTEALSNAMQGKSLDVRGMLERAALAALGYITAGPLGMLAQHVPTAYGYLRDRYAINRSISGASSVDDALRGFFGDIDAYEAGLRGGGGGGSSDSSTGYGGYEGLGIGNPGSY